MSDRGDIETYQKSGGRDGLTYTCNCGWVDVNHTKNESVAPEIGAKNLWNQMLAEERKVTQNGIEGFVIKYGQDSARKIPYWGRQRFNDNISEIFIRSGLDNNQKAQVALSIFIEKSLGFEELQKQNFSWFSNTGFSEEDLVSNILGFYNAVRKIEWRPLCQPISVEASLKVWDSFIKPKGGLSQNTSFLPNFYECNECPVAIFPATFNSIQPIEKGILHFDFDEANARHIVVQSSNHFFSSPFQYRGGLGFLDVPKTVTITVMSGETEYFFCRRALKQAAFQTGLDFMEQINFVESFFPLNKSFKEISDYKMFWVNGDPSNDRDESIKPSEFIKQYNKPFTYKLNKAQISELRSKQANRFSFSPNRNY